MGVDNPAIVAFKYFLTYSLTLYYNLKYALIIAYLYVTKSHTEFWVVKARTKPKTLTDSQWGEHKFVTVNVSRHFFLCKITLEAIKSRW